MKFMKQIEIALKKINNPIIRERLLMVKETYDRPLRDVAKTFSCVHGKVDYWKKRYEKYGVKGLETKQKSGRPKKITDEQEQNIRSKIRKHNIKDGWRTKKVREMIYEDASVKYSFRHTIRILQSWGLSKIVPRPRYAFSKKEDRNNFLKKTRTTWHVSQ